MIVPMNLSCDEKGVSEMGPIGVFRHLASAVYICCHDVDKQSKFRAVFIYGFMFHDSQFSAK